MTILRFAKVFRPYGGKDVDILFPMLQRYQLLQYIGLAVPLLGFCARFDPTNTQLGFSNQVMMCSCWRPNNITTFALFRGYLSPTNTDQFSDHCAETVFKGCFFCITLLQPKGYFINKISNYPTLISTNYNSPQRHLLVCGLNIQMAYW